MAAGCRNDPRIAHEVFQTNITLIKDSGIDCLTLADKLREHKIISESDRKKAKDGMCGKTAERRLSDLLDIVKDTAKGDGDIFDIFIKILREEDTRKFNQLAETLEKKYDEKVYPSSAKPVQVQQTAVMQQDNILNINDQKDVLDTLTKHSFTKSVWRDLGMQLGLSYDTLSTIEDESSKTDRKLDEAISRWLRGKYDQDKYSKPSWRVLVSALRGMNENAVAEGIEKEKCQ